MTTFAVGSLVAARGREWTWLPLAERVLRDRAEAAGAPIATTVSTIVTDPWTARFGA